MGRGGRAGCHFLAAELERGQHVRAPEADGRDRAGREPSDAELEIGNEPGRVGGHEIVRQRLLLRSAGDVQLFEKLCFFAVSIGTTLVIALSILRELPALTERGNLLCRLIDLSLLRLAHRLEELDLVPGAQQGQRLGVALAERVQQRVAERLRNAKPRQ
jgi:hypothetical protein